MPRMNVAPFSPSSLCIDCSGPYLSVALRIPGKSCVAVHVRATQSHDEHLAATVQGVLRDANLTLNCVGHIIVGGGPGSFTGIRIGMAFAKGLAWSLHCPLSVALSPVGLAWSRRMHSECIVVISSAGSGVVFLTAISGPGWPEVVYSPSVHVVGTPLDAELERIVSNRTTTWVSADGATLGTEVPALPVEEGPARGICEWSELVQNSRSPGLVPEVSRAWFKTAVGASELANVEPFYVRNVQAKSLTDRGKPVPARV